MPIPYNQARFAIDEAQVIQRRMGLLDYVAAIQSGHRLYAQGIPLTDKRVGPILAMDMGGVDWGLLERFGKMANWGNANKASPYLLVAICPVPSHPPTPRAHARTARTHARARPSVSCWQRPLLFGACF